MPEPITLIFGTRPEAIKIAPVMLELRRENIPHRVIHTGQHLDLADPILKLFEIVPDHSLKLMRHSQTPLELLQRLLAALPEIVSPGNTSLVLVQGDTTTALAGALSAHHQQIPVAHLEAGLRSHDRSQPFPEESNRTLISHLADLHFAPTALARQNLIAERIPENSIHVTGNSVVDALHMILNLSDLSTAEVRESYATENQKLILVTTHRRENMGEPLNQIVSAINTIVSELDDVVFVVPMHPNPRVRQAMKKLTLSPRIRTIDPLSYQNFIPMMAAADLILTDSGGIQEEAPALGTPVFVLRNKTERPELIESGAGHLIGTDKDKIVHAVIGHFKTNRKPRPREIFGDGHTAERVVRLLNTYLANMG